VGATQYVPRPTQNKTIIANSRTKGKVHFRLVQTQDAGTMRAMKIVLVRPNYKSHIITPPIGLGYLASFLKAHGIEARILDGLKESLHPEELVARALNERADAVGITCLTAFYHETVDLARRLKWGGQRVILGGVHPTFLPHRTLADSGCDYVIAGEGELALLALAKADFVSDGIAGVYSPDNVPDDGTACRKAETVQDLDTLPFPDWEQLDPRTYPKAPHGAIVKNYPIGVVTTTRGCPYACTFCASPQFYDRTIRFRTPANVIEEIKYLVDTFGVREIHFEDDNLTLRREHVESLCRMILDSGFHISWACPNGVRADKIDEPLLRLMKQSGGYYLAFGIESANQAILDNVGKRERIEDIEQAIEMAAGAGIQCQGFFVFGLPGETAETIDQTIRFAQRSKLARAQFLILDVLPGSQLWSSLAGRFTPNWAKNSFKEPEWIPDGLTREYLLKAQSRAFREFYLKSPRRLLLMARSIRPTQFKYLVRRLLDYRILRG
jgi:anaerobic magnesium-protoporphyrin IX monomethyl ester cyclase